MPFIKNTGRFDQSVEFIYPIQSTSFEGAYTGTGLYDIVLSRSGELEWLSSSEDDPAKKTVPSPSFGGIVGQVLADNWFLLVSHDTYESKFLAEAVGIANN